MTIPSVMQGLIEVEDGKVFELDSAKGATWLESVGSFRFEPSAGNKPYTVRKEAGKGGDYWYGYRKVAGRLHKKYIGKSSELSTARLEEIAEALNTPSQPRVTDKVTDKVTDTINQLVTDRVTDAVTVERFTALELQVQALQESLEALRSELPGKFDVGNFEELPTVTDTGLQIELGNLKAENEKLKQDWEWLRKSTDNVVEKHQTCVNTLENSLSETRANYAALLESSTVVTNKLREEVRELRSQLAAEETRYEELGEEYEGLDEKFKELDEKYDEVVAWWKEEEGKVAELRSEITALKQKSTTGRDLPDAADLLNQLKAKRKKSKTDLADMEVILEILEG